MDTETRALIHFLGTCRPKLMQDLRDFDVCILCGSRVIHQQPLTPCLVFASHGQQLENEEGCRPGPVGVRKAVVHDITPRSRACRDDFITHKDTSDWSSTDPYSRASTALTKLITRLRDILQGRYTTDPCHHCIRFCG